MVRGGREVPGSARKERMTLTTVGALQDKQGGGLVAESDGHLSLCAAG